MDTEQLLRNPEVYPSDTILTSVLGSSYSAYAAFSQKLPDISIETEWYYTITTAKRGSVRAFIKRKPYFGCQYGTGYSKYLCFYRKNPHGYSRTANKRQH